MGCPMNFGDLNIPSSRAFWDDCDEDEPKTEPAERLKLIFEDDKNEGVPFASDLFVLIEGFNVADFAAKTLLCDTKRICKIPAKNSSLHFNEKKKQLLAVLEEDLNSSGEVTELLLPYAKLAREIITITLKQKVEFKSVEIGKYRDVVSIVRGINANLKHVPELEAPNFIAGVAAGVASWRVDAQLPLSSYVVYTDKIPLDAIAAQPVLKLLEQLNVACSTTYVPPRKDDSHLYL